eukprot:GDKK01038431.1.p1 GENE.GDKK01038431.1~~GDKK01038431.1.p1  ORF type:complete len:104 (-),score=15.98 GDKK01038431.1:65-340(-)
MAETTKKVVMKLKEMNPEMETFAQQAALEALERTQGGQAIASYIKDCFEKKYNGTWHVIVGRNFSSYVSFEQNCYIYFYIGQMGVCIFKTP